MRKLKTVSNYFLYALLIGVFYNCSDVKKPKFYTWSTSIEVKYNDNTKDTIFNTIKLSVNDNLDYVLKTSEPTFFGYEKITPCLVMRSNWKEVALACDVKTFKILTQIK